MTCDFDQCLRIIRRLGSATERLVMFVDELGVLDEHQPESVVVPRMDEDGGSLVFVIEVRDDRGEWPQGDGNTFACFAH